MHQLLQYLVAAAANERMPSRKGRKGRKGRKKKKKKKQRPAIPPSQSHQTDAAEAARPIMPPTDFPPPPYENLRFAPGDIVLAHYQRAWKRGKILECNGVYYDDDDSLERVAYEILCDDDSEVTASEDTEDCVRPFSKEALLTSFCSARGPVRTTSLLFDQEDLKLFLPRSISIVKKPKKRVQIAPGAP